MRFCVWFVAWVGVFVYPAQAQELSVYSDAIVLAEAEGADLNCEPAPQVRQIEVLSPQVQAGGQLTLLLVARAQAGTAFQLEVGTNPEQLLDVKLFRYFPGLRYGRTHFEQPLEPVEGRVRGRIAEGQRCAIFFLTAVATEAAAGQRVRLEPAVWFATGRETGGWMRYPLEVRVAGKATALPFGWQRCEAEIKDLAQTVVLALGVGCKRALPKCEGTRELSVGALLAGQLLGEMPELGGAPACAREQESTNVPIDLVQVRRRVGH